MDTQSFSAIGTVNRYLRDKNDAETRSPRFRASDMGRCLRMRYYKRSGEKQDPLNDRVLRIFQIGHKLHELFQDAFEEAGILVSKEVEINYKEFLYGHYDALLDPWLNDPAAPEETVKGERLVLVDIKTVNSQKFHYMDKTHQIDPHYIKQIHAYCMILRKEYPGLTDCRILYVSKDDGSTREVSVPYGVNQEQAVLKELGKLESMWENQIMPPAVPEMDWECKYCPFQSTCPRGREIIIAKQQEEAKTMKL